MIYWEIAWSFFQIGLFSIGGGYAILSMIQNIIVDQNKWLTMTEFADLVALSQMTPGPIAINASTFVGTKMAGPIGGALATVSCVAPSCIIVLTLAYFYQKYKNLNRIQGILTGLRPAVAAMIASAGLSVIILSFGSSWESIDFLSVALFAIGLLCLRRWKTNPIVLILGAGFVGLIAEFLGAQ